MATAGEARRSRAQGPPQKSSRNGSYHRLRTNQKLRSSWPPTWPARARCSAGLALNAHPPSPRRFRGGLPHLRPPEPRARISSRSRPRPRLARRRGARVSSGSFRARFEAPGARTPTRARGELRRADRRCASILESLACLAHYLFRAPDAARAARARLVAHNTPFPRARSVPVRDLCGTCRAAQCPEETGLRVVPRAEHRKAYQIARRVASGRSVTCSARSHSLARCYGAAAARVRALWHPSSSTGDLDGSGGCGCPPRRP